MPKKIILPEVDATKVKKLSEGIERKKKDTDIKATKKEITKKVEKPIEILSALKEEKIDNPKPDNLVSELKDEKIILPKQEVVANEKNKVQTMNPRVVELLTEVSKKLDILIDSISKQQVIVKPTHIELSDLQLSELKFLKEVANDTIILNKYPGGNNTLIQECANLANRIDEEIHKRLTLY